jgi:MYXO-CTERM domain-containing protein
MKISAIAAVVSTFALLPASAFAFSGGRAAGGCPSCHGGAAVGTTVVSAVASAPLEVGVRADLKISVTDQSGTNTKGGFFAGADQDVFDAAQSADLLRSNAKAVSHKGAKSPLSDGWTVSVTPTQAGTLNLELWGNAVNGNGASSGDRPGAVVNLKLAVGGVTPVVDAGASDAGAADADAGATDAGTVDAGARDAGADAGTVEESLDEGGCSTAPGSAAPGVAGGLLVAAMLVAARRRR